ncbi:8480_t:CDS:2 [Cetraspora pellucida]|uniref:8480_t:CDS:1 n=1 Tax=Cetraspora pellucida TaxID=1433469 RepID=A0A9N9EP97_9GLOM|nr:8480_t:CDS:2 [Cetraspora pellucida]
MSSNDPNSYGTDDAFDEYIDMDFLKNDTMEEDVDIGNMSTSDLFRYYLEGELVRDTTNVDSTIYTTPMQNATDDFSMVSSPNSVTEEPKMNSINLVEEPNVLSQSTNVSNEVGPSLAMLNAQLAELLSKLPSFKQESYTDSKAPTLSGSTLPTKNNPQSNILATLKLSATPNNNKESDHGKLDDNAQIDLKKLSSKERRQLRNKISARNFRVRRKEYIQSLESTKEQQQEEINLLRQALMHLQEENTRLKQEVEELRKQAKKPINPPLSPPHSSTTAKSNAQRSKASQSSSSDPRYLIPDVNKDKLSSSSSTNQSAWQDPRVRVQTTLIPEFNLDKHLFEEKSAFPYSNIWNGSMIGQPSLRDVFAFDQRTLFAYLLISTVMQRLTTLFIEAVCATPQNKMIAALFPPETLTESQQSLEIVDEKDGIPDKISEQQASVLDWLYDTMVKHVAEQSKVEARIMELSDWVGEEWDDTLSRFALALCQCELRDRTIRRDLNILLLRSKKYYGSTNLKLYAIKEHAKTRDHLKSYKKDEIMSVLPEHIISLMKIIYCMAKEDLLLNKFKHLTHLGHAIEAPHLISKNHPVTYENNMCGRELLYSISSSIEDNIWKELSLASAIGIIVDESTDIAMESHVIIYVRYFINSVVKIQFLSLLKIEVKDAKSIYNVIIKPFIVKKVDHKIFSFTSDGASVMQGNISGIATRITKLEKTYLDLNNNCFKLSTNLNKFFISTLPKTNTKIGSYTLTWILNQENDLIVDIISFISILILEIQNQFSNNPFVDAMKIFKLADWSLNNQNITEFGNEELELLLNFYKEP